MKLSLWLFLCLMVLQLPSFSRGYGQSPKVSISGTYTLQQIFEKIEEQTGKQVYYANKIMDDQTEVTVKLANVSIDELLGNIIKDKNLTWKIDEKKIRIFKKNEEGIVPNNTILQ